MILDTLLTLIFRMGQYLVYEWLQPTITLFRQGRLPFHRLWIAVTRPLFNYRTYKTKNCWCSIDAHFQDGAGSLIVLFSIWKAANTSFMNGCNQSAPRCTAKNRWRSVEAHFQNGAVIVCFTLLPRKAASMLIIDSSDLVTIQLPYLQDWTLLTLRWRSFSGWDREPDTIIFDLECSQYFVYEWLQPIGT